MRENEKEREKLKASRQTLLVLKKSLHKVKKKKKVSGYSAAWDLYTTQRQEKLQKSMNWPLLHDGQFRQNKKIVAKMSKSQKGAGIVCSLAKFSQPCKISQGSLLLLFFSSLLLVSKLQL